MLKGFGKTIIISLSVVMLFASAGQSAQASGVSSVLPNAGINIKLSQGPTLETIRSEVGNSSAVVTPIDFPTADARAVAKEEDTEDVIPENIVIAQANDYINIRNTASEKGRILGKFYDDAVGTILAEENGWYQIQSGNVTGYVKKSLCISGEEAVLLAEELGTRMAKVQCDGLLVREEASAEATVLGMVAMGDELLVTEETQDWVKVDIEEGFGWLSKEFVKVYTEYIVAESKEEEAVRLKKEKSEREQARIAAAEQIISTVEETEENAMGIAVAEYAVQFIGNPYVWGGTSLTDGADCSGFVMSVYEEFGISLPHSSAADRKQGYAIKGGLKNAQPGDLICYSGHVAIYIGDGQIVHAASEKSGIKVSKADYRKILAIRRIF